MVLLFVLPFLVILINFIFSWRRSIDSAFVNYDASVIDKKYIPEVVQAGFFGGSRDEQYLVFIKDSTGHVIKVNNMERYYSHEIGDVVSVKRKISNSDGYVLDYEIIWK